MAMVLTVVASVTAIVIFALLTRFYFTDARRMTSEVHGRVLSAVERVTIEDDRRKPQTVVTIGYAASGVELELQRVLSGHIGSYFPVGRPLRVKYNPAEPTMARVPEIAHLEA